MRRAFDIQAWKMTGRYYNESPGMLYVNNNKERVQELAAAKVRPYRLVPRNSAGDTAQTTPMVQCRTKISIRQVN